MELSESQVQLRSSARDFARGFESIAADADEAQSPVPQMVEALALSGLPRLVVPAAYGGAKVRVDALDVTVVRESLMSVSSHLDTLFCMQGIGSFAVAMGGSEELKSAWLPKVANMEALAALALTEPSVGSDLKAITTTLTPVGDQLVLSGRKSFISNGGAAAFYCVLARERDGYSMVLAPADTVGLHVVPTPTIIAPHVMGELHFDNVEVPGAYRLGEPGKGFALVLATLGTFRVSVAGAAVGLAQCALDVAVDHARHRNAYGEPLIEVGAIGQMLARAWMELEAARVFTYHAASLAAQDPRVHLDLSSMAKVMATETAGRVIDTCMQVTGRSGLIRGSVIERAYRVARPMRTYEGGSEVILDSLARRLARGATL
ncbi:MAG: acyl-CoA dehydrogenase family protein [Candidatus Nanopelagicales bacterium]